MRIAMALLLLPCLVLPASAQLSQVLPTEGGTLNVELSTPEDIAAGDVVNLNIDFINPSTQKIQEHIDYRLTVSHGGAAVFGPIPLTHTSTGSVTIPVELGTEGAYEALVEVEGILFQPIPAETVSFSIMTGDTDMTEPVINGNNGCLIATAAYGSELAPQVQQLREIRDNVVMNTESGAAFMGGFNQLYYSFSPAVADLERENPAFREATKLALTPLLATLSVLSVAEIDSEADMLAYGISIIALNLGIYVGAPAVAVSKLYQSRRD